MAYLGAHMSVAGGVHLAFERIASVGGQAMQIFTRNQRQWVAKPIAPAEAQAFARAWEAWGYPHVASHAGYLINLASSDPALVAKSVEALAQELARCEALAIPWVVLHPGAHGGAGVEAGLSTAAANLDRAMELAAKRDGVARTGVLLENTAGHGSTLGSRFEELGIIMAQSRHGERLGVCLDTCHAHVAGYALNTPQAYSGAMAELDAAVGLARVRMVHLNDAKAPAGSHLDRHAHIGQGTIGEVGFGLLLTDQRLADRPMVLETPKGEDLAEDRQNLAVLHRLMGA